MWIRGTDVGCVNKARNYDHYCFDFVGPNNEYDGASTPYSTVSGWELDRQRGFSILGYNYFARCPGISTNCGWSAFADTYGLTDFCDEGYASTLPVYFHTPDYCKMGYEAVSLSATGTGCYPLSYGASLQVCTPCLPGEPRQPSHSWFSR